ncbi:MAG TPA: hypothetical protein DCL61_02290 [Cyanobacteria bacterium UBA12227]|nr:hypothetical protein [Cyanobacteria bacterium UBA12227]HAX85930.1 hypothetical protein [Cyanobacteria bacterium UBA11370]HBY78835.1 hypothetical protein [Cyanobacteria bacterium UBA11148]
MDFQLRKDARKWFKDISSNYPILFDLYYLCLMAGFASGRKNLDIHSDDVDDLVENFPGEFRSRGRLLVGLLIHTEISRLGIDLDERDAVYRRVAELVEPNSPSYMSNEGVRLMNQYAHGGFDALCEYFGDRPRSIETFIRKYFRCVNDIKKNV